MQSRIVYLGSRAIAVHESGGSGSPILLVHGNSSSGSTFRYQLESPLGQRHRMVAIDLPGHGLSSSAEDPESQYTPAGFAAVVVGVCEQLGIPDAILVGWSLGGHVVLRASTQLPESAGLMIYGTPPLGVPADIHGAFLPHPAIAAIMAADLGEAEIEALVSAFFGPHAQVQAEPFRADIRRTDPRMRTSLAAGILAQASGHPSAGAANEVDIAARLRPPLAVLHGAQEQLVNGAYLAALTLPTLWRDAVQVVPDAGHAVHWEQPERFNALLEAFARQCRPSSQAQA